MKRITTLSLLLALGVPALAAAQDAPAPKTDVPIESPAPKEVPDPQQSLDQRLEFLLSGYEYFPTRADLDAVAPADLIVATLVAFARDPNRRPTLRLRAVDALGHYDHPDATAYLEELVETPTDGLARKELRVRNLMRHHAVTSLARSLDERAVPKISPLLEQQDVQLKLTVINALAKHGGASGKVLLTEMKSRENEEIVQRELRKWVR